MAIQIMIDINEWESIAIVVPQRLYNRLNIGDIDLTAMLRKGQYRLAQRYERLCLNSRSRLRKYK